MSLTTAKFTELTTLSFAFSSPKPSLYLLRPFASFRLSFDPNHSKNTRSNCNANPYLRSGRRGFSDSSSPWLSKWPSSGPLNASNQEDAVRTVDKREEDRVGTQYFDKDRGSSSIERIVLRLRNLGLGSGDEEGEEDELAGREAMPLSGDENLGDLLQRDWLRPDKMLVEEERERDMALPWEREEDMGAGVKEQEVDRGKKKRTVKAPTLAELTIEDEQLRRLRRLGMKVREKINVPKAGITQAVLEKIHDKWRKEELVRLKFHEALAHDMKRGHEIVEVGVFDEFRFPMNKHATYYVDVYTNSVKGFRLSISLASWACQVCMLQLKGES